MPCPEIFANAVFGSVAEKLRVYRNRQYFRGVLPPASLASDQAVREFVASDRFAIGYVRASAVDDSVHIALRLAAHSEAVRAEDGAVGSSLSR